MKHLSLKELQKMTGLSDAALGYLLKEGLLQCSLTEENQLIVNIEKTNLSELMKATTSAKVKALDLKQDIAVERIAAIIRDRMEKVVNLALRSYQTETTDQAASDQDIRND